MELIPVNTPVIEEGDNLADTLIGNSDLADGDILVVSSKIVARANGEAIDLNAVHVSEEAKTWAEKNDRPAAFRQAVLDETERMHGKIINDDERIVLTELKPDGLGEGTIMIASAGVDQSNIPEGQAIGWPRDPVKAVKELRNDIQKKTGKEIAVILTDSCLRPRRRGLTAIALTVSGLDPLVSKIGEPDLYDKELRVTFEAVADQLATAANFLMGNGNNAVPAVVIRDHGLSLSDFEGWVPGIEREEDVFHGMI